MEGHFTNLERKMYVVTFDDESTVRIWSNELKIKEEAIEITEQNIMRKK